MIERPNNWNDVQVFSEIPKLPLGAYVCRIGQTSILNTDYGKQLAVLFDIEEGEFKGFYAEEFKASTVQDKKWKGVLRIWLPKNDGSEKDEWTKSSLKGFTSAVEASNPGYTWNWDEASLKNRLIGIIFQNKEWEYEGKHGWTVRPYKAAKTEAVRAGEITIPNDKPLANSFSNPSFTDMGQAYGGTNPFNQLSDEGELPF